MSRALLLVLLLLATPAAGWAAIAFDATSVGEAASTDTLTVSHTMSGGSDRILVACVATYKDSDPGPAVAVTATYAGAAMTVLDTRTYDGATATDHYRVTVLYKTAPATGANNITVTATPNSTDIVLSAVSYTGVDGTTPFGTPSQTNTTVVTGRPDLTISSETNDLVLGCVVGFDMGTITAGTGQTKRAENNNTTVATSTVMSEEAGAASVPTTWTWTTDGDLSSQIAVTMNPLGAGGGGQAPRSMHQFRQRGE